MHVCGWQIWGFGSSAWMGDFLCQYMEVSELINMHEKFDWDRAFAFSAFGAFYMGGFANFIYSRAIPWVISRRIVSKSLSLNLHSNARKDFLKRGFVGSIVDNTLHAPLFYLPSYFIFTDVMRGRDSRFIVEHFERSYLVTTYLGTLDSSSNDYVSVMPVHRATFRIQSV